MNKKMNSIYSAELAWAKRRAHDAELAWAKRRAHELHCLSPLKYQRVYDR